MMSMPHEPVEMSLPYLAILSYAHQWILAGNNHHVQELLNCAVLKLTTVTHILVHELVTLIEGLFGQTTILE